VRILYVEDNATNVILVQRVANMGKHEVITYDDGQEALNHFEQDKPDLIMLDVQLRGGLTGLDIAHTLRTKGCVVPVIAVTAYAMKGDRQRCLDAGCDDYLPKPISVAELVTVFKRYSDAVVAGKPILSTYKLPPAEPAPIILTLVPAPVVENVPKPAEVPLMVTPPAPAKEAAPVSTSLPPVELPKPTADHVSEGASAVPSPIVTVVDPLAVTPPSDPMAHRAPTPMNAKP
jgi:two-component system, cell cycle response regulator DivK